METKICSKCGTVQPIDEFSIKKKSTNYRETICKPCKREYVRSHYRANKEIYKKRAASFTKKTRQNNYQKALEYLQEHPCVDCGETDVVVLQFDHVREKRKSVSVLLGSGCCWNTILKEIEKCEVRCANCHTRKTAKQFNWKWKQAAR